jgi:hypothetical protein
MTELEQAREKIAQFLYEWRIGDPFDTATKGGRDEYLELADEVLSDPNIAILSDDQSLPDGSKKFVIAQYVYNDAQDDMVKQGWRKVVQK